MHVLFVTLICKPAQAATTYELTHWNQYLQKVACHKLVYSYANVQVALTTSRKQQSRSSLTLGRTGRDFLGPILYSGLC